MREGGRVGRWEGWWKRAKLFGRSGTYIVVKIDFRHLLIDELSLLVEKPVLSLRAWFHAISFFLYQIND